MKRYLNSEAVNDFLNEYYKSVSEFCRELGISRSHFDGMMRGDVACGSKTQKKLRKLLDGYDWDMNELLNPLPIIIGDKRFKEIVVSDSENNLVVSINSINEISDKKYKVEYIPFD